MKYLHKTNNNEKVTRGLPPPLKKVTKVTRIAYIGLKWERV